jgi:uncharacterized protein YutE (UPF0331/DUF86 family)
MNRELINRKLDSLARCIHRIESKRPTECEILLDDIDLQDILAINLERAVQLSVDIGAHILSNFETPPPNTMGDVFSLLVNQSVITPEIGNTLRQAVGFRNLAVHAYEQVDWQRVFNIVHHHMDDFKSFMQTILNWVELQSPPS